jgi:hypothetical protein
LGIQRGALDYLSNNRVSQCPSTNRESYRLLKVGLEDDQQSNSVVNPLTPTRGRRRLIYSRAVIGVLKVVYEAHTYFF